MAEGSKARALIVSVQKFTRDLPSRVGAARDTKRLHRVLCNLGFDVEFTTDDSAEDILHKYRQGRKMLSTDRGSRCGAPVEIAEMGRGWGEVQRWILISGTVYVEFARSPCDLRSRTSNVVGGGGESSPSSGSGAQDRSACGNHGQAGKLGHGHGVELDATFSRRYRKAIRARRPFVSVATLQHAVVLTPFASTESRAPLTIQATPVSDFTWIVSSAGGSGRLASYRPQSQRAHGSCFVSILSSHGADGLIYGADGKPVHLRDIYSMFTEKACPALAGKPKIFFVQACRGMQLDDGVYVGEDETDSCSAEPNSFSHYLAIPDDTAVHFSSSPDYGSFLRATGSVFLQTLCDLLQGCQRHWELLKIMTRVNCIVALWFESRGKYGGKKQMPCFVSKLRHEVYPFSDRPSADPSEDASLNHSES
ncbi:uncharacterized protein LOC132398015 [Hypanus sabinus]|uniref:uncharacterized protein LOC132398015 n=1 Tax=Hypanus sabinus TaxID=79690 RepID=UPI0028C39364|nr:uncharacterized protein LOC132398015 [Hypanus sabinus]